MGVVCAESRWHALHTLGRPPGPGLSRGLQSLACRPSAVSGTEPANYQAGRSARHIPTGIQLSPHSKNASGADQHGEPVAPQKAASKNQAKRRTQQEIGLPGDRTGLFIGLMRLAGWRHRPQAADSGKGSPAARRLHRSAIPPQSQRMPAHPHTAGSRQRRHAAITLSGYSARPSDPL